MGKHYVYALIDPTVQEPFYIGCGQGRRAWTHLAPSKLRYNTPLYRRVRQLMENSVAPVVIVMQGELPKSLARKIEQDLIALIGVAPNGPLLNIQTGWSRIATHRRKLRYEFARRYARHRPLERDPAKG